MPDIDDGKSERASTSKSLKSEINESEQLVALICTKNMQVSEKDISNENEKSHEDKESTDVAADITKEALSDSYFQCIRKFKFAAKKINSVLSCNATAIHFESSLAEVATLCNTAMHTIEEAKSLADCKLKIVQSLPDEFKNDSMPNSNPFTEHDPAKRPQKLTHNQLRPLIANGPCQPILHVYPTNINMAKKGKQCSFSKIWITEYPYLEYSLSSNKAYCFACSLFGKVGPYKEKAETAWIAGMEDWAKMKGSRGKNKSGKLQNSFSSSSHTAALANFSNFVQDDNKIEALTTKTQRGNLIDTELQTCKNKEVIAMLLDVTRILCRNGLALRGGNNDENDNFRQIVGLLSCHNPTMKAWHDNRQCRKYRTSYLSPESQNELIQMLSEEVRLAIVQRIKQSSVCAVMADTTPDISVVDQMSVAVRYINNETCKPEERLVKVTEALDKYGAG